MSSAMDGDLLSFSTSLSASPGAETLKTSVKSDSSLPQSREEHKSPELWTDNLRCVSERLLSSEEQVTLITESLTVTSNDQEKLLLLNKNTELRRVNKELMKLNEDWDQVYRSATLGLQRQLEALELENSAIKQLNGQLLLKSEHQQSAKSYYEQALMTELKKNQDLQEYIRFLESRMHHQDRDCQPGKQNSVGAVMRHPSSFPSIITNRGPELSQNHVVGYNAASSFPQTFSSTQTDWKGKCQTSTSLGALGNSKQEVKDLKEQLEAQRCQTKIHEAEYQTEQNDHKHTLEENQRLRKKREEMRQQVSLLQEQLKIYEDDFRRERSDKQILQRLLLQKTPANKDPVLIHRCNNDPHPLEGDKSPQSGDKKKQHHPLCPKHRNRDKNLS